MVWAVYIVPDEPWRPGVGAGISQESPGISRTISQAFSKTISKSQIFLIFVRSLQWLLQLQACVNRNGACEAQASFERTLAATYVVSLHHGLKRAADALA